jgi:hypothetical protein
LRRLRVRAQEGDEGGDVRRGSAVLIYLIMIKIKDPKNVILWMVEHSMVQIVQSSG